MASRLGTAVTSQSHASLHRRLFGGDPSDGPRAAYQPMPPVQQGGLIVSTRRDVEQVLRDAETYSSAGACRLSAGRPLRPLELDSIAHMAFRAILEPLFAPGRVVDLTKMVTSAAGELIDSFADEPEIDFSTRFSVPFPAQVLVTLLGLPLDDLAWVLDLKDGIIRPGRALSGPLDDPEVIAYQTTMIGEAYQYFDHALDRREQDRTDDLLSDLLDLKIDGALLHRSQLLDVCMCLLIEGIDPVSAALDCFFACLAGSPTLRAAVVASPRSGVEELLRWETPTMFVARTASKDASLGGCPISAGQRVFALLGAANLDPSEFSNADTFQAQRKVNRHLSFGSGSHRCLGSHLARMQLLVALREWHARIPDYSISQCGDLRFAPGVRTAERFPMRLGRTE